MSPLDVLIGVNGLNEGKPIPGAETPIKILGIINYLNRDVKEVCDFNDPPTATDSEITIPEDEQLTFPPEASDPDREDILLTPEITRQPSYGTVTVNPEGTFTYVPGKDFNGSDSLTYRVNDGQEKSNEAIVTITVEPVNDPPVITVPSDISTPEDTAREEYFSTYDPDEEQTPPTVSVETPPENGSVVVNEKSITYTPKMDFAGTDTVVLSVEDAGGGKGTQTVSIIVNPVNDAPKANDLSLVTKEDEAVNFVGSAVDIDGDTLTYSIERPPENGTLTVDKITGTFTYIPKTNFHGVDTFSYYASDGETGNEATVTITIHSVNDPVITPNITQPCAEDSSTIVDLLKKVHDPENDTFTIIGITQPQHGSATLRSDSSVKYVPNPDFFGKDTFTYTAADAGGMQSVGTITIDVINQKDKIIANDDVATTDQNTPVTIDVLANDTNLDRDRIRVLLAFPGKGTVVINPDNTLIPIPVRSDILCQSE